MKTFSKKPLIAAMAAATLVLPGVAMADSLSDALKAGTTKLNLRYRAEDVSQDNAAKDAMASTLKTRLTYTSGKLGDFQMQLEVDNVSLLGGESYNSKVNGNGDYSVIADPDGTDLNQAWVAYTGFENTTIKWGRQRVVFDNQRFVGGVAWRQDEQTYDALAVVNTSLPKTTVVYGYVDNVNTILGGDLDTSAHVLNVKNTALPFGTLTGYAYLLDVDVAPDASTDTYGVRLAGSQAMGDSKLLYTAEFARQSEGGDSSLDYSAGYYNLELGVAAGGFTAKLGREVLAAGDGVGFATPLATKHKFNGWADMFLATPADGLEDNYLSVSGKLAGAKVTAVYHDFKAEDSSADYGSEFDIAIAKGLTKNLKGLLKYASYNADGHGVDTDKLWVQLQYSY